MGQNFLFCYEKLKVDCCDFCAKNNLKSIPKFNYGRQILSKKSQHFRTGIEFIQKNQFIYSAA